MSKIAFLRAFTIVGLTPEEYVVYGAR